MTILTRFLGLKGRIGRLHYWLLLVLSVVIVLVAATIGSLNLQNRPIQWLSYAILLSSGWPVLSATTRRLRDADLSPWYGLLLVAVPTALQVCGLVVTWGGMGVWHCLYSDRPRGLHRTRHPAGQVGSVTGFTREVFVEWLFYEQQIRKRICSIGRSLA
jgi:uncharacterized membrane protein YhaH (DUF805 family)